MGLDNPLHIAFLVVILLLVFGAKRLPEIGRSLGSRDARVQAVGHRRDARGRAAAAAAGADGRASRSLSSRPPQAPLAAAGAGRRRSRPPPEAAPVETQQQS